MADYNDYYICRGCGVERSYWSFGDCPACAVKLHDQKVTEFMDLYREDPEEAFRSLVSLTIYQQSKLRKVRTY